MTEASEKKVRYNPGNLGDLLKHGWLVEIVRFLHRHKGGRAHPLCRQLLRLCGIRLSMTSWRGASATGSMS